jgi:hypothetical protein
VLVNPGETLHPVTERITGVTQARLVHEGVSFEEAIAKVSSNSTKSNPFPVALKITGSHIGSHKHTNFWRVACRILVAN